MGSGAFGKVVEATAYGLGTDDVTRVAVKMLKRQSRVVSAFHRWLCCSGTQVCSWLSVSHCVNSESSLWGTWSSDVRVEDPKSPWVPWQHCESAGRMHSRRWRRWLAYDFLTGRHRCSPRIRISCSGLCCQVPCWWSRSTAAMGTCSTSCGLALKISWPPFWVQMKWRVIPFTRTWRPCTVGSGGTKLWFVYSTRPARGDHQFLHSVN